MLAEGNHVMYTVLSKGTVVPAGLEEDGVEPQSIVGVERLHTVEQEFHRLSRDVRFYQLAEKEVLIIAPVDPDDGDVIRPRAEPGGLNIQIGFHSVLHMSPPRGNV